MAPHPATDDVLNASWQSYAKALTDAVSDVISKSEIGITVRFTNNLKSRNKDKTVTARFYHSDTKRDEIIFELPHQSELLNLSDAARNESISQAKTKTQEIVQTILDALLETDAPAKSSDRAEKTRLNLWLSHSKNLTKAMAKAVTELNSNCTVDFAHNVRSQLAERKILTADFYQDGKKAASVDFEMPRQDEVLVLSHMEWEYRVDKAVTVARLVVRDLIDRGFELKPKEPAADGSITGYAHDASNASTIVLEDVEAAESTIKRKEKAGKDPRQLLANKKRKDLLIKVNGGEIAREPRPLPKTAKPKIAPKLSTGQLIKLIGRTEKLKAQPEHDALSESVKFLTPELTHVRSMLFSVRHLTLEFTKAYQMMGEGREVRANKSVRKNSHENVFAVSFINNGRVEAIASFEMSLVTFPRNVLRRINLHKNVDMRKPVLVLHGTMGSMRDKHQAMHVLHIEEGEKSLDRIKQIATSSVQQLKDKGFFKAGASKAHKPKKVIKTPVIKASEHHKRAVTVTTKPQFDLLDARFDMNEGEQDSLLVKTQEDVIAQIEREDARRARANKLYIERHVWRALRKIPEYTDKMVFVHAVVPSKPTDGVWKIEFKSGDEVVSYMEFTAKRQPRAFNTDPDYRILLDGTLYSAEGRKKAIIQYAIDKNNKAQAVGINLFRKIAGYDAFHITRNEMQFIDTLRSNAQPTFEHIFPEPVDLDRESIKQHHKERAENRATLSRAEQRAINQDRKAAYALMPLESHQPHPYIDTPVDTGFKAHSDYQAEKIRGLAGRLKIAIQQKWGPSVCFSRTSASVTADNLYESVTLAMEFTLRDNVHRLVKTPQVFTLEGPVEGTLWTPAFPHGIAGRFNGDIQGLRLDLSRPSNELRNELIWALRQAEALPTTKIPDADSLTTAKKVSDYRLEFKLRAYGADKRAKTPRRDEEGHYDARRLSKITAPTARNRGQRSRTMANYPA